MATGVNVWDAHASELADWYARRERDGRGENAVVASLLALLGDLANKATLDAGCGEGFFSRVLAARGARVTGIDIGPRLIALARERDPQGTIAYRVADLTRPLPALAGRFDRIGSHLALNDIADHRGFAAVLATLIRPGGRAVLAFNNPYSLLVRGHLTDYFASGTRARYGGMSAALGGEITYTHRTLEEFLDAFLVAGWRLAKLADVPGTPRDDLSLSPQSRFPFFTVLAFDMPE